MTTFGGVRLIKHRLGVDDALDVSSVHVRNPCSARCHTPRFVLRPLGMMDTGREYCPNNCSLQKVGALT